MEVVTLLATADYGILMQDSFPLVAPLDALLGIHVPKLFFTAMVQEGIDGSASKMDEKVRGGSGT